MDKKPKKTRDAKPGELREIRVIEILERMSKRPESRMDVQRFIGSLTPTASMYLKHLVVSGPSSVKAAAKALELKAEEVETALAEIELGIEKLRA